ncbi:MAG: hypothetical protein HZA53_13900 [Planctomycetes bacterium]|nr:hypothetical protein [Planctomycetota bacterium]
MNEPVPSPDLERSAAEHIEFRRDIGELLRILGDTEALSAHPRFSRELDALRHRLAHHFEHEELSWSALGERLQSREFCEWTAEYTAQHRELDERLVRIVDEFAHRECLSQAPVPEQVLRLEQYFRDLIEHERGETHLLARAPGVEDEGWSER